MGCCGAKLRELPPREGLEVPYTEMASVATPSSGDSTSLVPVLGDLTLLSPILLWFTEPVWWVWRTLGSSFCFFSPWREKGKTRGQLTCFFNSHSKKQLPSHCLSSVIKWQLLKNEVVILNKKLTERPKRKQNQHMFAILALSHFFF